MSVKLAKICGIFVSAVGVLVMFGWFANIPFLTSIHPDWVTMKFATAFSFLCSGVILYLVAFSLENRLKRLEYLMLFCSLLIFVIMFILFVSVLLGFRSGIEDIFVQEKLGALKTTVPGRPSVGTMVDFLLMAIVGIVGILQPKNMRKVLPALGWIVGAVGILALAGYLVNTPALYYTVENVSTAMAIHTAILFVVLGIGLIFCRMKKGGDVGTRG